MPLKRLLFFSVMLILSVALSIAGDTITVSFQDLEDMAKTNSPQIRTINEIYNLQILDNKIQKQWSNPEIETEIENVKNDFDREREYTLALSKNFSFPWTRHYLRAGLKEQSTASKQKKQADYIKTFAGLKTAYILLKLMESQIEHYEGLSKIIENAELTAANRQSEGAISGLEHQLIQMSLLNLKSQLLNTYRKKRELTDVFKLAMGFSADQDVQLTSVIGFKNVSLDSNNTFIHLFTTTPEFLHHQSLISAQKRKIQLERTNILPGFQLSGGYKQVNTDLKGFVVGLSMPLPLLNTNRPQIRKSERELNLLNLKLDVLKKDRIIKIKTQIKSIREFMEFLQVNSGHIQDTQSVMQNLVYSYREGWIPLGDVLDGVQVLAESVNSYYVQLGQYYENIFQLEALTGKNLIEF
ncbi:TolC family protein [candidate division KSB1 bacterium]|nr:TolC family protein [candidate division KSB1 bacterium]